MHARLPLSGDVFDHGESIQSVQSVSSPVITRVGDQAYKSQSPPIKSLEWVDIRSPKRSLFVFKRRLRKHTDQQEHYTYHPSPITRWLQTSMFCLLVFVWRRTSVPRRRHTSGLLSTAATLFHRQIVRRSTHTQHMRRQELRCRRATCLWQSSGPLARRGHYIRQFQAWTQNVLF